MRSDRSFGTLCLLVLLLSPLGAAGRSAEAAQTPTVAITNVAVIDVVTGATRANQTVLISGNRISAVGPTSRVRVPPRATTVDGSGKFLVPGMWDLHTHAAMFGRASLALFLANGVTGIRDMGAERFAEARAWRDSIATGTLILTPREALAAATIGAARVVGMADSLGTIETGKLADLVLLDANPLSDITNTRRIRAVIANGRLIDRASLDGMLVEVEAQPL